MKEMNVVLVSRNGSYFVNLRIISILRISCPVGNQVLGRESLCYKRNNYGDLDWSSWVVYGGSYKWQQVVTGSVRFSSVAHHVQLFVTPWSAAHQASLSFTTSRSLLRLMSMESVMPSNHLVLCHPLLLPSIFPSIRVFSNESVLCIRWPKHWNFSIDPSNEYSGLISFTSDWFDPLADSQESSPTPQFKCINSSVLCFLYGPTLTSIHEYWKNHSLDYGDLCQ